MIRLDSTRIFSPVRPPQVHERSPSAPAADRFTSGGAPETGMDTVALLQSAQLQGAAEVEAADEVTFHYPGREGYDTNFLGRELPLPTLKPELQAKVAPLLSDPSQSELEYTNFSIVMNKERRQPFFSAVNIDGSRIVSVPRDGKWTIDGRIAREHQLGNEAYSSNPIDRGHQVRRRDAAWGEHAHRASNDTFAYTNAAMQHGSLNQKEWLELENHVLDTARNTGMKMTVLTGPVLRDDDPKFDNRGKVKPATQMPQEFWKVVVWNDPAEGLKGSAFVLSQADYVGRDSLYKNSFEPGRLSVYQVPLETLEEATGLGFGPVADASDGSRRIDSVAQSSLPGTQPALAVSGPLNGGPEGLLEPILLT